MKKFLATAFAVAATSAAFAGTYTFSTPIVSGGPAGTVTVDILFDLSPTTDDWTAGGLRVITAGDATLKYQASLDPNLPSPTGPGTGDKFSSFVNNPRGATANARFTSSTSFAGSYLPAGPLVATSTEMNVAWLESPPASTSLDTAAATSRITLNTVSGSSLGIQINGTGPLLATVDYAAASTDNGGNLSLLHFTINAVPEPASLALLALGGLLGFRRR